MGFVIFDGTLRVSLDISPFVVPHVLGKECWAGDWMRLAPEVLSNLNYPVIPPRLASSASAGWGGVCGICLPGGCSAKMCVQNPFLFGKLLVFFLPSGL